MTFKDIFTYELFSGYPMWLHFILIVVLGAAVIIVGSYIINKKKAGNKAVKSDAVADDDTSEPVNIKEVIAQPIFKTEPIADVTEPAVEPVAEVAETTEVEDVKKQEPKSQAKETKKEEVKKQESKTEAVKDKQTKAEDNACKMVDVKSEQVNDAEHNGKYEIRPCGKGYQYVLIANNGQEIFFSDEYASAASCKASIKTFKKNADKADFCIEKGEDNTYHYSLKKGNGGEYIGKPMNSEAAARANVESVIKFSRSDDIIIIG